MEALHEAQNSPAAFGGGSGIDLFVTVKDKDGRIVSETCKEGDLYLLNFGVILASMFKYGFCSSAVKPYYLINRQGVQIAYTGTIYASHGTGTSSSNSNAVTLPVWADYGRIILGSSNKLPSILDYEMGTPVKEFIGLVPTLESEGNTIKVCIAGTTIFDTAVTICEAGLSVMPPWWGAPYNGNGARYPLTNPTLITRDIFEAQTVPAGGSVTIRFELWWNAVPPAE